jgi:UDP-glucose 4-epimerase
MPGCSSCIPVMPSRLVDFSADQIDALTYGRAMDTSQFTSRTGFVPKFTSLAALQEFVGVSEPGLLSPERVDNALEVVSRTLGTATVRDG